MNDKELKMPEREPDFHFPLVSSFKMSGWIIKGNQEKTHFLIVLQLKDGQNIAYAEALDSRNKNISNLDLSDEKDVAVRDSIAEIIFYSLVKNYSIIQQ